MDQLKWRGGVLQIGEPLSLNGLAHLGWVVSPDFGRLGLYWWEKPHISVIMMDILLVTKRACKCQGLLLYHQGTLDIILGQSIPLQARITLIISMNSLLLFSPFIQYFVLTILKSYFNCMCHSPVTTPEQMFAAYGCVTLWYCDSVILTLFSFCLMTLFSIMRKLANRQCPAFLEACIIKDTTLSVCTITLSQGQFQT